MKHKTWSNYAALPSHLVNHARALSPGQQNLSHRLSVGWQKYLIFRLLPLLELQLLTGIAPNSKPMLRPLIHHQFELPLLLLREDGLDLLHPRHSQRDIEGAVRDAQRLLHGLDVVGQCQRAGMRREACIDQTFAIGGFFGIMAQEDNVTASPAEARCADGEVRGFVLPERFEEVEDDGLGDGLPVLVHEGDEVVRGSCPGKTGACVRRGWICELVGLGEKHIFIMFPRIPWFSAITLSMLVNRSGVTPVPDCVSMLARCKVATCSCSYTIHEIRNVNPEVPPLRIVIRKHSGIRELPSEGIRYDDNDAFGVA